MIQIPTFRDMYFELSGDEGFDFDHLRVSGVAGRMSYPQNRKAVRLIVRVVGLCDSLVPPELSPHRSWGYQSLDDVPISGWISADVAPPEDEELWLLIQDCLGGRRWVCMGMYKGPDEWTDLFIGRLDPCRYRVTHWQLLVYPEIP